MGYSFITINDSDRANSFAHYTLDGVAKKMSNELKREESSYNTSGAVNVALFFESFITPNAQLFVFSESFTRIAKQCKDLLSKEIEDTENPDNWEDESSRLYHNSRYKALLQSLEDFLQNVNDKREA